MEACRVPPEEAIGRCSWCGKTIGEDVPVFAFGGKKRPGVDIAEYEGQAIRVELLTQEKAVVAIVCDADSEAKREGYDFMFMICSEKCGKEMKAVLENETSLGDTVFRDIENMGN